MKASNSVTQFNWFLQCPLHTCILVILVVSCVSDGFLAL